MKVEHLHSVQLHQNSSQMVILVLQDSKAVIRQNLMVIQEAISQRIFLFNKVKQNTGEFEYV